MLIVRIACILQGEAGYLGSEAMEMVACSMQVRLDSPDFPDDWRDIVEAYNGSQLPSLDALVIGARLIFSDLHCTRRCPFVFSERDRKELGLFCGAAVGGETLWFDGKPVLHFYPKGILN